jgi:hypothetical protein
MSLRTPLLRRKADKMPPRMSPLPPTRLFVCLIYSFDLVSPSCDFSSNDARFVLDYPILPYLAYAINPQYM